MKILLATLLLAIVTACASPYRQVYVSNVGDYYIAESRTWSDYHPGSPAPLYGIGLYPWWSSANYYSYTPWLWSYYSPYFYPHRFSIWNPPYHRQGWYGAYSPWCPPYRSRHVRVPVRIAPNDSHLVDIPVMPPGVTSEVATTINPELLKLIDPRDLWVSPASRRGAGSSSIVRGVSVIPTSTAGRSPGSSPINSLYSTRSGMTARNPAASGPPSGRTASARSSYRVPVHSTSSRINRE